jgi:hypothetical protein
VPLLAPNPPPKEINLFILEGFPMADGLQELVAEL